MKRNYVTLAEINDLSGFFDVYAENRTSHFDALFPNITENDKQALNNLLTDVFGERVILSGYEKIYTENDSHYAMSRIVDACDLLFYSQWREIQQTIATAYNMDVSKPLAETRTISTEREGTDGNETQDKTNAFNDTETASDTDSTETSGTHSETVETTETKTKSNGKTASENAETLINFARENDFLNMMLNDIVGHCTVCVM